MSEVLQQENAIILAAAQKFVALGSEIAQRSILGKESDDLEEHSDKILKYLTVYRKGSSLETKALEAVLYALRDLSESNLFPTVDPIVGQSIQYLVSQSAVTISDTMQIQSNGTNLTLVDTLNFYNLLTASYDSGNDRVNVVFGGTMTQNTSMNLGNFDLTIARTGTGNLGIDLGSDATYDMFYRNASGNLARLAFATVDGHVVTRVGGALAWAAPTGSGYDTIQNAGSGVTQRATVNFLGALQAVDNAGSLRTDVSVKNAGVTYAMIQNVTNNRLLGNATGSAAAPSEISVSAPLALGSSTLSIAQAGTGADGYLAASDWNTFNNKLGATLTSAYFYVGNGSNVATGVAMSGDASLANTGAVTVTWANGYPTYDARYLTLAGGTLTGFLTLHADPTNSMHAATKNYVDNLITGISWKNEVVTATTANITLSGEQTIDGVLTSTSRVLVKDQTDATTNGIYLTDAGAWTRTTDADTGDEIAKATVYVAGGSTHGGTQWTCTNSSITLGSSNITWGQISGTGTYTDGVGLDLTGNVFSVTINGIVNSLIRPSAGLSVMGRSANSTGDIADIVAGTDGDVLRRSGTTLGFGTIGNASITGLEWSKISSTPTTLAGYGITNAISTSLASGNILVGNGGGVAASVTMSGQATIDNAGVVTLSNAAVIAKVLTGFSSGAGTVAVTDTILQAIQKLDGNVAAKFTDPMTTRGDILYRNASNVTARLPVGANTFVLTSDGTDVAWAAPSGGGGGSLSDLTAATGTNTIDNTSYAQEWQWNSLAGATGLKLSSNSTAATGNAQALFEANLSGANATSTQTTFAARFVNSHTGTSSTNVAGYFEASGGTNNNAIVVGSGNVLLNGAAISFGAGTTSLTFPYLDRFDNNTVRVNGVTPAVILGQSSYATTIRGGNATPDTPALSPTQSYQSGLGFTFPGGGAQGVKLFYYTGSTTTMGLLLNESGSVLIGGTTITTNAILDLQSTTKAFIPPRMTTIQKNAIGSPSAGMIVYDTDLSGLQLYTSSWGSVGGGIGGSTGAVDNAILRADGTGGSTLQGSAILLDDTANITLGLTASTTGTIRSLTAAGTATDIDISLVPKGTQGRVKLTNNIQVGGSVTGGADGINGGASGTFTLYTWNGATGSGSSNSSNSILIKTGHGGTGGNTNSGNILLNLGAKNGTGTVGNIGLFTDSVADWQDMEKGLFINNITTEPTAAIANGIALYSKDSSDGSTNSTLGLYLEQAVEAIGTFTPSHKLKVWINGTEYWIQLDAV